MPDPQNGSKNIISESRFLEELLLDDEQFTAAIVFTKALATSNRVPLLKFAGFCAHVNEDLTTECASFISGVLTAAAQNARTVFCF